MQREGRLIRSSLSEDWPFTNRGYKASRSVVFEQIIGPEILNGFGILEISIIYATNNCEQSAEKYICANIDFGDTFFYICTVYAIASKREEQCESVVWWKRKKGSRTGPDLSGAHPGFSQGGGGFFTCIVASRVRKINFT